MSNIIYFRQLNLQMFAEGSGGEGGTGAEGATNGVPSGVPSLNNSSNSQVANGNETSPEVDLDSEFESLIKGKYKDQYGKRMQDTMQKRLKSTKETVDNFNALKPTLDLLSQKYGVDASDIKALNDAIAEDDSYYEDEALQRGISVAELKQVKKIERENAELRSQLAEKQQQEQIDRDVADWMRQAEEAKGRFPNLDLQTELQNPQFIGMLKNGIDLETAYFAMHNRELVPQAMNYAYKTGTKNATNKIMSNGARASENGLQSTASAVVSKDVSRMSRAEREDLAERARRGERIVL